MPPKRSKRLTREQERNLDIEIGFLEGVVRRDPGYLDALQILGDNYTRRGRFNDGLKVDEHARVLMTGGTLAANVFAAGEVMAGNILGQGYIAGIGMTIGTVFGRIAGTEAASHALH